MSVHPKALCGREMMLTGVDTITKSVEKYGNVENASVINFVLDDVIYSGIEDPSDGYRSMMESLEVVTDVTVTNMFEGCVVIGAMGTGSESEVLQFTDIATGKIVLQVGTSNSDEYYPSFVSSFEPRNMSCNVNEDSQAAAKARILERRAKRKEELMAKKLAAEAELRQLEASRAEAGWGTF